MFSEDFEEGDHPPLLLNRRKNVGNDNKRKRKSAALHQS